MKNDIEDNIIGIIENLLKLLGQEATVNRVHKEEGLFVDIEVEDAGRLIGEGGKVLDALQFIVYRMAGRLFYGRDIPSVIIDINGYRRRREDVLKNIASDIAERVRSSGESILLEPMSAWERRVVHMAVKDTEEISTESEDTENGRSVRIKPEDESKPEMTRGDSPKD